MKEFFNIIGYVLLIIIIIGLMLAVVGFFQIAIIAVLVIAGIYFLFQAIFKR